MPISFIVARRYEWVNVSTDSGMNNNRINTKKKILIPILENHGGFWVVSLDKDEFVQWSIEGYFEYWKDGQMLDRINIVDNRLAIKKLYVDFLKF